MDTYTREVLKHSVPRPMNMLDKVPEEHQPKNREEFWKLVAEELQNMIMSANSASNPSIKMNDMRKADNQYIWEFYVNDLDRPRENSYNWYFQNTSQWVYAGAIVLEEGEVSAHH